jgi:hypothetical protein
MAKYLVLIYGDERAWEAMSPQESAAHSARHAAFAAAAGSAILDGNRLESSSTATSLRGDAGGHPTPTDGPFLESKEVLGGYYIVEATDLDAVIALVRRLPEVAADHSGVEIRPIVDMA